MRENDSVAIRIANNTVFLGYLSYIFLPFSPFSEFSNQYDGPLHHYQLSYS